MADMNGNCEQVESLRPVALSLELVLSSGGKQMESHAVTAAEMLMHAT